MRAVLGLAVVSLALFAPVAGFAQDKAPADISGVWWIPSYSPAIHVLGGGEIPFTPAGRAAYEKNIAGLKDGSVIDEARRQCVPDGVPRILGNPYPFKIVQTPGLTSFIYELNHMIRMVPLNEKIDEEIAAALPWYSGHSTSHWEGDTLVIETKGYSTKSFLDATGVAGSAKMSTVERVRRIGAKQLEDVITISDPVYFSKPWSARFVYDAHPEVRLQDYVCGERNRDISNVPGIREARRNLQPFVLK